MDISVTYRHLEPNESLRTYAEEKVSRIKKYLDRRVKADVVLAAEKKRYLAEVNISGDGIMFNSKGVSAENLFAAIDLVTDKLMKQASRYKSKLKDKKGAGEFDIRHNIISHESIAERKEPEIIHTENYAVKPMTVEEAVMQLKLRREGFLVFTNSQSNQVNVVYQRQDGHYGLIEAERFSE